jgi:hypothetical protein
MAEKLKFFGEVGVVTTKDDIQGKLRNRGTFFMFDGYSVDHANNVYCMLNLDTKGIVHCRDIKWLNLYHNDLIAKKSPVTDHVVDDDNGRIIFPKKAKDIQISSVSSNAQYCKTQLDATVY